MKTKLSVLFVSLLVILSSCAEKESSTDYVVENVVETPQIVENNELKPFSNPVLIYGTSFGDFFQMLYKQGKFNEMLKFTSSGTISKFGSEEIVDMYKNMAFAYDMRLKSTTGSDTIFLNYEAGIYATKHMVRIPVVIENDTTKIVLYDLKDLR